MTAVVDVGVEVDVGVDVGVGVDEGVDVTVVGRRVVLVLPATIQVYIQTIR